MREFLESWNRDLLDDEYVGDSVRHKFIDDRWLGNPPATSDEIRANEERLGVRLPPSYRSFLEIANGWVYPGNDMDFPGMLRSVERIEWATDSEAYVVKAFADDHGAPPVADREYFVYGPDQDPIYLRPEYLEHCLLISDESEGGVYLLNKVVQTDDGEWEAWHLNSHLPGAYRSRSFLELMRQQRELLLHYRNEE